MNDINNKSLEGSESYKNSKIENTKQHNILHLAFLNQQRKQFFYGLKHCIFLFFFFFFDFGNVAKKE